MELNASDTRSKNSLKEVVAESLNNTTIKDFCSGMSCLKVGLAVSSYRRDRAFLLHNHVRNWMCSSCGSDQAQIRVA